MVMTDEVLGHIPSANTVSACKSYRTGSPYHREHKMFCMFSIFFILFFSAASDAADSFPT